MRAVAIGRAGGPDVLELVERERPRPRQGELLIRVAAAGVNRPDVLQRLGRYPVPADADPLPGLEVAGLVEDVAAGVDAGLVGQRVMALAHGGGYAEYCRVPAAHCLPVPAQLSLAEAAAVPETLFTVWYNVFMRAALLPGERLLVHGGSSGIGTMAIQLALARDAEVFTTAGTDEKCRFCEGLGAVAINYRRGDWSARMREQVGERGVDVVLDMVAGDYVAKNLELLARDGRYALIAFLGGRSATLDLGPIVAKRLTVTGSTLRPQTIGEKARIAAELRAEVLPLLADGRVKPLLYRRYPLAQAADAHRLMESGEHMGKIVLEVAELD